jgi:hypothetical protein
VSAHAIALADNLLGGARKQIMVVDSAGVHVLELDAANARLRRVAFVANGTRIDGWVIDTGNNRRQPAGDLDGDGRAEMFICSAWCFGVLDVDAGNHIRCHTLTPYGSVLKGRFLQSGDVDVGYGQLVGAGRCSELLVVRPYEGTPGDRSHERVECRAPGVATVGVPS